MSNLFLFLYIINGLMVLVIYGDNIDFKTKKPLICAFNGNKVGLDNPNIEAVDPKNIPPECDLILYTDCEFSDISKPSCPDFIKTVANLKRPFIVEVFRPYEFWAGVLKSNGNAQDAKTIVDFVKANGAIGVLIGGISKYDDDAKADAQITNNAAPYFKQLKSDPKFVVGINLNPDETVLTDPCVFNYEASNEIVDFYMINTYRVNNDCDNTKFNGVTPTTAKNGLIGLDTIVGWAKTTKICMEKVYLVVDLTANTGLISNGGVSAYSEACMGKTDTSKWCLPTTKDLYDKAAYIVGQKFGIVVYWIEFDDVSNACGCCAFIGLKNIAAGYTGGKQTPCGKIDTKPSP